MPQGRSMRLLVSLARCADLAAMSASRPDGDLDRRTAYFRYRCKADSYRQAADCAQ
jgi:hypothetical protein